MAAFQESKPAKNLENFAVAAGVDMDLNDLLDLYEDAIEAGERPDLEDLCRECPELLPELKQKVAQLERIESLMSGEAASAGSQDTLQIQSELTQLDFHRKGGLGAVYSAYESSVHRQVAVKFIHRNLTRDEDSRRRFELEAEVTGRLEHPGVVPLYGTGEADNGRLFYYMRFVDGETMDDAICRFHTNRSRRGYPTQSVEFRRLLTSFVSVCRTVAYAHARGIVHRDIKPSNIMLGRYGETLVVDWGLAASVTRDSKFNISGEVSLRPHSSSASGASSGSAAGTVAYMSPEQASDLAPTPASDVYSLGASLYKLLVGEPSVSGDDHTTLRQRILNGDIVPPSKASSGVPAPLEAICSKAMALHPSDRYATALELADDIENYLADAKVEAFTEPFGLRIGRLLRKNRSATRVALIGASAIVLVVFLSAIWLGSLARDASHHEAVAIESRDKAQSARRANLRSSARFLAEAIGHQIDKRWRVLETVRSSPELLRLLRRLNEDSTDANNIADLQNWVEDCNHQFGRRLGTETTWTVYNQKGVMAARQPKSRIIGDSFAYRDYFHGKGADLESDDPQLSDMSPHKFLLERLTDSEHRHSACVSNVIKSVATGRLHVVFSVPVWDQPAEQLEKKAIGLLGISLPLKLLPLPSNAMLVRMDADQLTGKPGLVISHPRLRNTRNALPPHLPKVAEAAEELRMLRIRQVDSFGSIDGEVNSLIDDFVDPVVAQIETKKRPKLLAAFEPVIVPSRPESVRDIGWLVIVHE